MNSWYLVHTKIRQEQVALENLERQGFECFLPLALVEHARKGALQVVSEPLFPRYLFIRLGTGMQAQSWAPIRSTLGVSRLVTFGQKPAMADDQLVAQIRTTCARSDGVVRAFNPGEAVVVTHGPFAGLEAVYQATSGEGRAMVLLNLLSKPVSLAVAPTDLRKAS